MKVYGDTHHIDGIIGGQTSILSAQDMKASEGFDITRRNIEHPFFSSPTSISKFNNQRFALLKNESRFKSKKSPLGVTPDLLDRSMYDIKGNTFKNTLLPKETYNNTYAAASCDMSETGEEDEQEDR